MLHLISRLIPPPLHRLFYRVGYRLRRKYYRWRGGRVSGCTMMVRDAHGRFLLVRHSYGPPVWTFPGGGLKKGEDPAGGAAREFAEELNCSLENLRCIAVLEENFHGAQNTAHVFTAEINGQPVPDQREIVEVDFFALEDFPANLSNAVARRIRLLDKAS